MIIQTSKDNGLMVVTEKSNNQRTVIVVSMRDGVKLVCKFKLTFHRLHTSLIKEFYQGLKTFETIDESRSFTENFIRLNPYTLTY